MQWYPMLKIAEMSPLWMIFPALMAFLHRGTARALYATHNSAFLILGNVLMLVNLGAIYYRFYRLAEHFDVSPGWAVRCYSFELNVPSFNLLITIAGGSWHTFCSFNHSCNGVQS